MAWTGARGKRLPPDWPVIRRRILARDPDCQLAHPGRCTIVSTEVDHIIAGDDHHDSNLQGVCGPCHATKSAREGHRARFGDQSLRRRPQEPHPGDLTGRR